MRKVLAASAAGFMLAFGLAFTASPASAESAGVPVESACNTGWYVNPDETDSMPEQVETGFKFEGKDLVHHAAPSNGIDLADMDKVSYSFDPTTAGKVVFKVETSAPYSTIVTNADGKLWSTAMTYDQEGGQGHPVDKYTDFIGKPVKTGKVEFSGASQVETFGVGYWVEEGSTVVKSITFHGTKYNLACEPKPKPEPIKPQGPQVKTPTCDFAKDVTIPTDEKGVKYTSVLLNDGKKLLVTAASSDPDKYQLEDYPANGWEIELSPAKDCAPPTTDPTGTPTATPTTEPGNGGGGPVPSQTSEPAPSVSTSNAAADAGDLPVTGPSGGIAKLLYMFGTGALLIAIGGAGLFWARRRRDAETVES